MHGYSLIWDDSDAKKSFSLRKSSEIVGNHAKAGNMAVEMGEKHDEDGKVDILTRITDSIDNHLRGFRVRKERVF